MSTKLSPGIVARILTDEWPENIGKRIELIRRPIIGSDLVCTDDVNIYLKGWIVKPLDDLVMNGIGTGGPITIKAGETSGMFMIIFKESDIEVLDSDNTHLS